MWRMWKILIEGAVQKQSIMYLFCFHKYKTNLKYVNHMSMWWTCSFHIYLIITDHKTDDLMLFKPYHCPRKKYYRPTQYILLRRSNNFITLSTHCLYLKTISNHDFLYLRSTWALSTTFDDVIKWKHFPRHCPFVRGIHRSPVDSPPKGQWRGALMFSNIGRFQTAIPDVEMSYQY